MARIKMPAARSTAKEITFEEAFHIFLTDSAARGLAEKTLKTYRTHLRDISHYFDISTPLGKLSRHKMNEMVVAMRESGLATNSISSYVRVTTTFLNWCRREKYCDVEMPKFKPEETVKETYTDEDLLRLLERPSPSCRFSVYRTLVIINFLLNSGCRAATVRSIKNCDVDLEQHQVITRHNKNKKVQVIPLCRQMVTILREYQQIRGGAAEDYLFCNECGEQLTESALRQGIARYNQSRGVSKTGTHLFRHTFARKYLMDCGGNAFTLQKLLGHSTLKMTKHYCNIFDADIAKNFDECSPLAQIKSSKGTDKTGKGVCVNLNIKVQLPYQNFSQPFFCRFGLSRDLYSASGILVFIAPLIKGCFYSFGKMFAVFWIDLKVFGNLLSWIKSTF